MASSNRRLLCVATAHFRRRVLPQNVGHVWRNASNKKALLSALENEKTELNARKVRVEAEERDEKQARIDAAAIPPKDALDRIHRYETANRRHRYQVEKRLDELLSRRRQQEALSGAGNAREDSSIFTKRSHDVL
jgi:hypothetical protein